MNKQKVKVYTIETIIEKVIKDSKHYDLSKILSAYEVAFEAHRHQKRDSGEPYISHPLAVAYTLLELGMDTDTICAALLHDVVEDTDTTLAEIKKMFGQDVAMMVDGVTKLGKIPIYSKAQEQAENVRKILLAMAQDVRVIVIKLCDRLHNMRTLGNRPYDKQLATSNETLSIFAPIAQRLGIRVISDELEDISFRYLDPFAYKEIESLLSGNKEERDALIGMIKENIKARLEESDFADNFSIEGRVKSVYAIYKKTILQKKEFDEVYDKYAIRIIVNTVLECYNALGLIHDIYTPFPNRFKDYIASPKPNMYQSLHTTVMGGGGVPFEVQIRTWEMHRTAEEGIAAHWKYKEGIKDRDLVLEERLAWVRQIIDAQSETHDVQEIVRTIKYEYTVEELYVLTPKGDVISLPNGSTVIDFAYQIHSEIGNKMKGAKVNGRLVPFHYTLSTGEVVEIFTHKDPNHGPSRAWLDICATSEAKSKIRSWFKKERREENIVRGKTEIEKEFKRNSIHIPPNELLAFFSEDMKRHNCVTMLDFYAAVGYGGLILSRMMPRFKERYLRLYGAHDEARTPEPQPAKPSDAEIVLDGETNILVKYSQCCNPLPGDDIIGFVTRGHGLSIHKKDCENYKNSIKNSHDADRWVKTVWSESAAQNKFFKVTLDIVANNSYTIISDVVKILAEIKIPLTEMKNRLLKNGNTSISLTINVGGVSQLSVIMSRIKKLPDIISVDRVKGGEG
ncbi:MAG: bifunctional (p)ppGpp synthetase/guanosine-3',5'-bis(diphosphate) 3'-pyrophosphohydrolase [Oscillospiraceae bacterium]|nr:bifunctional (p)ppGpp synthetase/guanosine-3',5'-bis(diphosphate) 3'-pyrophosphohydrolase [Oscillospiraceae bacterium]